MMQIDTQHPPQMQTSFQQHHLSSFPQQKQQKQVPQKPKDPRTMKQEKKVQQQQQQQDKSNVLKVLIQMKKKTDTPQSNLHPQRTFLEQNQVTIVQSPVKSKKSFLDELNFDLTPTESNNTQQMSFVGFFNTFCEKTFV
jgi:hypothetical protein